MICRFSCFSWKVLLLPVLLLSISFLSACQNQTERDKTIRQQGYQEGFKKGQESGDKSGYSKGFTAGRTEGLQVGRTSGEKAGYKQGYEEGFEKVHPGTNYEIGSAPSYILKVAALLGLIKFIIFSLVFGNMLVFRDLDNRNEIAGKMVFILIGLIAAGFFVSFTQIHLAIKNVVLLAAPSNLFVVAVLISIVTAGTYWLCSATLNFLKQKHTIQVEAVLLLLVTLAVTLLGNVLIPAYLSAPDIIGHLGGQILMAFFLGGLIFVAVHLLERAVEFQKAKERSDV